MANKLIEVNVRWFDGYLETFQTTEVRFGSDLLWMRLANGTNRHIPLNGGVRWFSLEQESHGTDTLRAGTDPATVVDPPRFGEGGRD